MRKMVIVAACVLGLAIGAVDANADLISLSTTSDEYVGMWRPPQPADPPTETANLNWLADQAANSVTSFTYPDDPPNNTFTHTRSDNYPFVDGAPVLPDAYFNFKDDTEPFNLPVTIGYYGFLYIIGKYDGPSAGTLVWYLGDLDPLDQVEIPLTATFIVNGQERSFGLSHYSLFGSENIIITPDGGTTLALLGCALLAVGALRRKFGA